MDVEAPQENDFFHVVQTMLLTGWYHLFDIKFHPVPSESNILAWREILN